MKIIRYPQLKDQYGIDYSRVHLQRLENTGRFPRRVRLNPSDPRGHFGWFTAELDAHLAALAALRDSGEAA